MISDPLRKRLDRGRTRSLLTLEIPLDVLASLDEIAKARGYADHRTLVKALITECIRKDGSAGSTSRGD